MSDGGIRKMKVLQWGVEFLRVKRTDKVLSANTGVTRSYDKQLSTKILWDAVLVSQSGSNCPHCRPKMSL
jgi:hypothetical protein